MQILRRQRQRRVLMLASALLALGLAACGQTPTAADYVARAAQFQRDGQAKAAIIELKNALQLDANDAAARLMLASAYLQTGEAVSAEKEIRKAGSLGATPRQTLPLLSQSLLDQGKYALLLQETDALLPTSLVADKSPGKTAAGGVGVVPGTVPGVVPNVVAGTGAGVVPGAGLSATPPAEPAASAMAPELLARRGEAYLALRRLPEAEAAFRAALAARPGDAAATTGLGRLAVARNDLAEADRLAQQAVAARPRDVDAWMFKGDLARAQFKFDAANAAYDQVLALDGKHLPAHLQKAYLDITAHRFDAAKTELALLRKNYPGNLLVSNMQALLDFTRGDMKAAMEQLQRVLAAAPDYAPALLLAGATQYQLGAMAQAEQHLAKYLQTDPDNPYARKLLASTLLSVGRGADALALLAPLLKEGKDGKVSQDSQLFHIAGRGYMSTGQHRQARDCFRRASELEPNAAPLHTALGMSLLSLGETDGAVAEMERALQLDPASLEGGIMLINTQLALGQPARALAVAGALERTHPDSATLHNLKGSGELALHHAAPARAAFERALALDGNYFVALNNLAQIDLREAHPELARQRYMAFLDKNANSVETMQALAALEQAQGRGAETTRWLERAAAVDPDAIKPGLQLARHYMLMNQPVQGLTLVRRLRVLKPEDTDVLDVLAVAQFGNDDLPGALETYGKLAALQPASAAIQHRLGMVYLAMGNPAGAAAAWSRALQLQPDFPQAQLALANLYLAQAQYAPANIIARQLQLRHGGEPLGFALEGDIALAQKKPAAAGTAAVAYARALTMSANPQLLIKLCEALRQSGQAAQAASRLQAWRKQYPDDLASALYLGETQVAARDYAAAIATFELVLKRQPGHAGALNDLAWSYHQVKDPRALATAERAAGLAAGSPSVKDTLGWILLEQGDVARALPLLREAVKLSPDAAAMRYHLALALLRAQDKAAARVQLEYLLSKHKDFPQHEDARALLRQL